MERALKERIIGAAILVIFVVSVVPVFLDGPPADGEVVSERVLLPGQKEQDTKTVVLERDRSTPIPASGRGRTTFAALPSSASFQKHCRPRAQNKAPPRWQ